MPRMAEANDGGYLNEGDGLCIADRRKKRAREGDFQGLWQELLNTSPGMIDQAECFRLLLQAMEVAARNDPRQFSVAMFTKIVGFSSYLLLRSHFHLGILFARYDGSVRNTGNLLVPHEVIEALPDLMRLQEHLAAMIESQARAARMWGLADKARRGHPGGETASGGEPADQRDALPLRVASSTIDHMAGQA